jgi:hypothetical protein
MTQATYEKPTALITLKEGKLKTFPLRPRMRAGYQMPPFLFSKAVPARAIRQKLEIKGNQTVFKKYLIAISISFSIP